jgi:hypothetical protein
MNREQQNAKLRAYRAANGNAATHKYEKTPSGFLMRTYRNMKSRITGVQQKKQHLYAGLELLPKHEFYEWAMSCPQFNALMAQWVESSYDRKLTPSIDRIDTRGGYTIGNMQWLPHCENSRRGGYWKPSEHGLTQYGQPLAGGM